MTPVRRIVCPSCEAGLKVPATLAPQKRVRCPKCDDTFRFAQAKDWVRPVRKAVPVPALATGPILGDEEHVEQDERPLARKVVKKQLALSRPMVLGLGAAAAVLLIGVGITLALVRPWETKKGPSIANSTSGNSQPRVPRARKMPGGEPGSRGRVPSADSPDKKAPGGSAPGEAQGESLPAPAGKEPTEAAPMQLTAGKKVFDSLDCAKCHALGSSRGGFKKGPRGPSLAHVGADPAHTPEWLSDQIRNPRSHRPNARMPAYPEDKISGEDLRSLAEYLASFK